jgi:tRNA(adenine34) deaminase
MHDLKDFDWLMNIAIDEAYKAYGLDEVPIGAVIVDGNGNVLSQCHNLKESVNDPCGHAEILAIKEACEKKGDWRLNDCTLFVTLEPCPMCLSAMIQARLGKLVFGAYDAKGGAISLNYNLYKDKRLNHNFDIVGGVKHFDASQILSRFFREKRSSYKKVK